MESGNNRKESRRTFIQSTAAGVAGLGTGAASGCVNRKKETGENDTVTLEILEPHGELAFPERHGLSALRLRHLNGKKLR